VNVSINEKYFEQYKKEAKEQSIADFGEEENTDLYFKNLRDNIEYLNIDSNTETIEFNISTELGYVNFEWSPDSEDLVDLITIATKKMNRIKTVFETMKKY